MVGEREREGGRGREGGVRVERKVTGEGGEERRERKGEGGKEREEDERKEVLA